MRTLPTLVPALAALALAPTALAQDTDVRAPRTAAEDDGAERTGQRARIGQSKPFGLGVSIGEPTAISGKLYLQRAHALDMAIAFGPDFHDGHDHGSLYAHAVYLVHPSVIVREPGFNLGWHVGAGGVLNDHHGWTHDHGSDLALGVRTPIGLDFDLKDVPLQFFGDIALDTYVVPSTTLDLGAAIGARYYF